MWNVRDLKNSFTQETNVWYRCTQAPFSYCSLLSIHCLIFSEISLSLSCFLQKFNSFTSIPFLLLFDSLISFFRHVSSVVFYICASFISFSRELIDLWLYFWPCMHQCPRSSFFSVDSDRLRGFYTACCGLLGMTPVTTSLQPADEPSLVVQLENCRESGFEVRTFIRMLLLLPER